MFYELASSSWQQEEIDIAHKVIDSGMYSMGQYVQQFEMNFAQKMGKKHALMFNSGSSANLIGVAALFFKQEDPLQRGDEVIVPAVSWATTYYPLQQYGLKLKFVDVELDTLNIAVDKLEQALTPKTKMVVAVNILGNPCQLDVISSFCKQHGLYLFEDNCESMGATLNEKQCGTFGDIGTFSTFFSHHIATMEGGLLVTDDDELYQLGRSLRNHGWTRDQPQDSQIYTPQDDDFFEAYRFILPGYNVRPTDLVGAIGVEQLKKLDDIVATRRQNGQIFVNLFANDERFIIQKEHGKSSWFAFAIILNPQHFSDRKAVLEKLKTADIGFRIITGGNFLRHDVIQYFDYECVGEIKNANIAHDYGFFVGNHQFLISEQLHELHRILVS